MRARLFQFLIASTVCLWMISAESLLHAEEAPLASAELRGGIGLAVGGGSGESTMRISPMTISALASYAIEEQPWVAVYGGLFFEGYQRGALGAQLGLRLHPGAGGFRVSAATSVVAMPVTAYGLSVGMGRCAGVSGGTGMCIDMEATVFGLGDDLPDDRIATQVLGYLGVGFDLM